VKPLTAAGMILVALLAVLGTGSSGSAPAASHSTVAGIDTSWGGWYCPPQLPCPRLTPRG